MLDLVFLRVLFTGLIGFAPPGPSHAQATPVPPADTAALAEDGIDFGDDTSMWANDGECDDKRFTGPGMTDTALLEEDIGRDASDCRAAWQAGDLALFTPITENQSLDGVDFGDDSGDWVHDNQCDDPRFAGEGMATSPYADNRARDATDCMAAWQAGTITLADQEEAGAEDAGDGARITTPWTEDGVDFGTDSGAWANDGECDDPRFAGEGMTTTTLLDEDIRADASDCLAAWRAGTLTLREDGGTGRPAQGGGSGGAGKISNDPGQR